MIHLQGDPFDQHTQDAFQGNANVCGMLSDLPRKEIPDWISYVKFPLKFWMLLCLWNTLLLAQAAPRNIILILSDDHRYDFMSFMEQSPSFLETPHLDRMAAQGVHFRNAFVTTSLCSPSRATILTGQYTVSYTHLTLPTKA